jgi:hypothetical protein
MTNQEVISRLVELKSKVEKKEGRLFFFVADTNGAPMASIEHIYKMAGYMHDQGYNIYMLHEKEKFTGVRGWLGNKYADLNHIPLSSMNDNPEFQINGSDIFFIPELYSDLIKKLKETKLPSDTVVICQSHSFIFKYLNIGENWSQYGVEDVITTSEKMRYFLNDYQPVKNIHVINPVISEDFFPSELPQKPIISIITRSPDETERIAKLFYQKYPMYSWVAFRTFGNMKKSDFAASLRESCLSIWVDEYATFGTFPLESMASGVPVLTKIPDLIPEWSEKLENDSYKLSDNAVYLSNVLAIPDYIAKYMEAWLLDDIPNNLFESMVKSPKIYSQKNFEEQTQKTFDKIFENKIEKINQTIKKYQDE